MWIEDLKENLREAVLILVGNKIDAYADLETAGRIQVSREEGMQFMRKHKLHYFTEVSAKTPEGIKELTEYISKCLYHQHKTRL